AAGTALAAAPAAAPVEDATEIMPPELERPSLRRAPPPRKRKYGLGFWFLFAIGLLLNLIGCGGFLYLIFSWSGGSSPNPPGKFVPSKTIKSPQPNKAKGMGQAEPMDR